MCGKSTWSLGEVVYFAGPKNPYQFLGDELNGRDNRGEWVAEDWARNEEKRNDPRCLEKGWDITKKGKNGY